MSLASAPHLPELIRRLELRCHPAPSRTPLSHSPRSSRRPRADASCVHSLYRLQLERDRRRPNSVLEQVTLTAQPTRSRLSVPKVEPSAQYTEPLKKYSRPRNEIPNEHTYSAEVEHECRKNRRRRPRAER